MSFIDVKQNTEEWDSLRLGRMTLSKFSVAMAHFGKPFGEPAKEYAHKLALERLTGNNIESSFKSSHLDRGHEQEPIANALYQEHTFNTVLNGGFYIHDKYKWIGGSPDGRIVGENKGLEIKSVIWKVMRANIKRNTFDPSYKWQLIGQMWVCGFDIVDYCCYSSDYPIGKQLFIHTIDRDDVRDELDKLDERMPKFLDLVDSEMKIIMNR